MVAIYQVVILCYMNNFNSLQRDIMLVLISFKGKFSNCKRNVFKVTQLVKYDSYSRNLVAGSKHSSKCLITSQFSWMKSKHCTEIKE